MTQASDGKFEKESFYDVFDYEDMMLDAGDGVMIFFYCTITKDIQTETIHLIKTLEFEQIEFYWGEQKFCFISYLEQKKESPGVLFPAKGSFKIEQKDLAPFLVW